MVPTERMKGREKEKKYSQTILNMALEEKHVCNSTKLKEIEN